MRSYKEQRERYLSKVLELHQSGLGLGRISRIIPVSKATIRRWIIKFAAVTDNPPVRMKKTSLRQSPLAQGTEDMKALQGRIRELEEQLRHERLRADFYDEMINVAEARFNISIRKKAGAKR